MNLEYKIFVSEDGEWFVAARRNLKVIYEGPELESAYKAILKEAGIEVPIEERVMEATYVPTEEDFKR